MKKGEYGLAALELDDSPDPLFAGLSGCQQVWMSHRDVVAAAPPGFSVIGPHAPPAPSPPWPIRSAPCTRLQFHPEVVHTTRGREYLSNFVFRVCGCTEDWDPRHRVPMLEREIREAVGSRNVFFFVCGGVDSTVAFTLCMRALGADRVRGVYVDTGLMREGETDSWSVACRALTVEHAEERFLGALAGVTDPERKRHIIGEEFVRVQERIVESRSLLDEHWILGQGTIYPDTIESGGTAKASLIKTHHNRVAGIQEADRRRTHRGAAEVFLQGRSTGSRRANWDCPPNCWSGIPFPAPAWPSAVSAHPWTRPCGRRPKAGSSR